MVQYISSLFLIFCDHHIVCLFAVFPIALDDSVTIAQPKPSSRSDYIANHIISPPPYCFLQFLTKMFWVKWKKMKLYGLFPCKKYFGWNGINEMYGGRHLVPPTTVLAFLLLARIVSISRNAKILGIQKPSWNYQTILNCKDFPHWWAVYRWFGNRSPVYCLSSGEIASLLCLVLANTCFVSNFGVRLNNKAYTLKL